MVKNVIIPVTLVDQILFFFGGNSRPHSFMGNVQLYIFILLSLSLCLYRFYMFASIYEEILFTYSWNSELSPT